MQILGVVGVFMLVLMGAGSVQAGSCIPKESITQMPNDPSRGWLSKVDTAQVRRDLHGFVRGESRWEGDRLITTCHIEDSMREVSALEVNGASGELNFLAGANDGARYFTDLAARTGHSKAEGEVLARKYFQLGFFKYVTDENGQQRSESDLIYQRHQRALGMGEPEMKATKSFADNDRVKSLQKEILAAKQRGDMNEMMRLAMEAQQLTAPVQQEVQTTARDNDRLTWQLLEEAYPELSAAAYKSRIRTYELWCMGCDGLEVQ